MQAKSTPRHHGEPTTQPTNKPTTSSNDTINVSAWDLHTTQGTLQGVQTAFEDISTVLRLIYHGNLALYQIQALARITHTYSCEWIEVADGERQTINKMLGVNHE